MAIAAWTVRACGRAGRYETIRHIVRALPDQLGPADLDGSSAGYAARPIVPDDNSHDWMLLRYYRGDLERDVVLAAARGSGQLATLADGLTAWHLIRGEVEDPRPLLGEVVNDPHWARLAHRRPCRRRQPDRGHDMSHPVHIVDVFAEHRFGGNQLAVVLDADDLTPESMQQIALETNFSETTFVTGGAAANGGYPVRIFTPGQELPFAGHPTLGTAWVLREHRASDRPSMVRLNLGVGQVPVEFESEPDGRDLLWLLAPPIELGPECHGPDMAVALGIEPNDLDRRGPVQQVSAGIVVVIVPVRTRAGLERCRLDLARYAPLRERGFQPFVYVFCDEPAASENDLAARFFFEANGVREDPATGSATACLGRYLLAHRYLDRRECSVRIEQGSAVGRPSLLMLDARQDAGSQPHIRVGGHVVPVIDGRLV